jgi:hypothetical protein
MKIRSYTSGYALDIQYQNFCLQGEEISKTEKCLDIKELFFIDYTVQLESNETDVLCSMFSLILFPCKIKKKQKQKTVKLPDWKKN